MQQSKEQINDMKVEFEHPKKEDNLFDKGKEGATETDPTNTPIEQPK